MDRSDDNTDSESDGVVDVLAVIAMTARSENGLVWKTVDN